MDDIIFEKDYRETESAEYDKWCDEVFDRAVNCGMLKAYSEAMDKIPKIIVPEDKKNYEYLLERCDAFVKQHRGYIKGIVDYHRWHAEINMFLPFAEFDDSEDLAFLKEIAEKSQTVCFSPEEEGGIRVHIFINYFEELMSAEHKSYIEYDAIMQDKKLSELLGIPELSDEEKELALKMKGILDRIDEETRIDRATVIFFGPVVALANLGASLTQVFASADRVLDLLDEQPVTADVTDGTDTAFAGAAAEHVNFAYANEEVLHDLSLTIPEKKIVGITGRSGSGKSTFLRLLMRFWDVSSGSIRFGAEDIRRVNTAALREQESLVTQETELFDDTIENNIRIAKRDATREEVEAACKKAALDGFIHSLPKGYDTPVGELGGALSGGERQRIGVARAFLHDAPFLLLDEPTSNLDSLNEGVILKAVRAECKDKTVLLVSHRKSTMAAADVSFSVESGRLS